MNQNKKKFNWISLIIWIILLAGAATLIWYIWFKKEEVHRWTDLVDLAKAKPGTIKEIISDPMYLKVHVFTHNSDYWVSAPTTGALDKFLQGLIDNGNSLIKVSAKTYSPPNQWLQLLFRLLPVIIIIFVMVYFARKSAGGSGGGSPFSVGNNKALKMTSDKRFSDIAGNEEVKEEVMELIDYLKKPEKYKAAGAKIPKGILLGGPPGTGKTLIAKATAGEAGVPFYFISASNFVEMFVGVGAKRVREMFKEARRNSPCIIFIDELDAVGRSRGTGMGGGNDEREQTLNQLLVEMDGMADNTGLLVIAATNRPDVLDPALQRPGRFDRTITVNNPDIKEREAILKVHAKGKRISKDINFEQIAKRTPGYSGAQLENVINEASLLSVREDTGIITAEQIDEAIDRVMAGPAKKSRVISKEELKMVAEHEAGHAVIGIKVPGGQKVQKITIIPRGQAGGYNLMTPEKETYNSKKSELYAMIMSFMGGRAAEQIIYGKGEVSTGASNDIEKATRIARAMVTQFGMSEELGPIQYESPQGGPFLGRDYMKNKEFSDQVGFEIDKAVRSIMLSAEKEAIDVIKKNMDLHKAIVKALLEKETIVAEEIEHIAKHGKLPDKKIIKKQGAKKPDLKSLIKEVKEKKSPDDNKTKDKTESPTKDKTESSTKTKTKDDTTTK
ncbi:MAG: ATP-dependent zinc metalloprotease FtsH [Mycoplasma sp.]|nr:ATP-dependent zinc metalloprotease FtsH [Mycoplasma sp.]